MKLAICAAVLCCLAAALAVPATQQRKYKIDDQYLLKKQQDVLKFFNFINQPSYYKDFAEIGETFHFEQHWDYWTKPQYAKEFYYHYEHDFLPQGEVFSVFYPEHLKQAIALFKVFYYAKDYQSFYTVAAWARQHVNAGMYVYALSVAIAHRDDTYGLVLPPIYEIFPHYFFNDEVIAQAQQYKQHYWGQYQDQEHVQTTADKGYLIHANYSGWYVNTHPEQSMTYFTEDVGLNAYYYYFNIYYPFWMDGEEFGLQNDRRGEQYYYVHQQLLARYYLERLSNDFGEIPHFSWEHPIETGYYPSLHYPNGLRFPVRPNHAHLYYHGAHGEQAYAWYGNYSDSYTYVKDYELRLRDVVDAGFFYTESGKMVQLYTSEGFETLGNLVESNADSPNGRFYGDLHVYMRHLLGYSHYPLDQYKAVPSALEHFETSLRDPMFYQMYKRIMHHFHQYKSYEDAYHYKDLFFSGVKIEGVEFDKLVTYFDYFYTDLSNAVYVDEQEFEQDSFQIHARQFRLNHKPYTYKLHVQSDKPVSAFVKVFIGPKYDEFGREISLSANNYNFVEVDRFQYDLVPGTNVITRNSQYSFFAADRTSFYDIYKHVMQGQAFHVDASEGFFGMPTRFLLPKGQVGGQTYQFFFHVAPYHGKPTEELYPKIGSGDYYMDKHYPLGYPFDKPIEYEHEFFVPNSYFQDVTIFHKSFDGQMETQWSMN